LPRATWRLKRQTSIRSHKRQAVAARQPDLRPHSHHPSRTLACLGEVVAVSGTARVTRDGVEELLSENESVYIPLGATHRLENPGRVPLHLIEVQSGSYLGEDDIVRFEDIYQRS